MKMRGQRATLVGVLFFGTVLCMATVTRAQPVNIEAAKKEGKVVVYGAQVPQAMEGLHKAFKAKYGIEVEYWRGSSTGVAERALSEFRAGKPGYDVVEGNRGVQLIMRDEGLFTKYIPPS
jgi:iron(III) transport system substrate-binding protein